MALIDPLKFNADCFPKLWWEVFVICAVWVSEKRSWKHDFWALNFSLSYFCSDFDWWIVIIGKASVFVLFVILKLYIKNCLICRRLHRISDFWFTIRCSFLFMSLSVMDCSFLFMSLSVMDWRTTWIFSANLNTEALNEGFYMQVTKQNG